VGTERAATSLANRVAGRLSVARVGHVDVTDALKTRLHPAIGRTTADDFAPNPPAASNYFPLNLCAAIS
jgi:hypothetical protein